MAELISGSSASATGGDVAGDAVEGGDSHDEAAAAGACMSDGSAMAAAMLLGKVLRRCTWPEKGKELLVAVVERLVSPFLSRTTEVLLYGGGVEYFVMRWLRVVRLFVECMHAQQMKARADVSRR